MTEYQFNQYNNLITFAVDWRKYKLNLKPLTEAAFRTEMQAEQYVKIDCLNDVKKRVVFIYLFDKNSKYTNSSQDLKKLLKKIKNPCDIILVTYKPLTSYGKRVIDSFMHLNIVSYRHEIFDLVLPHGPLCYPHRIMSRNEVLNLCNNELNCYLVNLPKIFKEDPQCIWIGANVGDVIEIPMYSDITGITMQYRVVIGKNKRIIAIKQSNSISDVVKHTSDVEDEDEEVLEHVENVREEVEGDISSEEEDDESTVQSELDD